MEPYDLVIVLQTYQRTKYALRTIVAAKKFIGQDCYWLVVDDGSEADHVEAVKAEIGDTNLLGIYSRREGYGALANRAWQQSLQHSDVTLWLEDDWELKQIYTPEKHDFSVYMDLLRSNSAVGMIRLARIPIGLHGTVIGDGRQVYLRLDKGAGQYFFSGNPSLRHSSFFEAYGGYPEGLLPGETELAYDRQIQEKAGPDIVFPFDIGTWGLFGHIGAEKSY